MATFENLVVKGPVYLHRPATDPTHAVRKQEMDDALAAQALALTDAGVDALDLAAGEVVRRLVRRAVDDAGAGYVTSGVFNSHLNTALSSPGLRRLTSLKYGDGGDVTSPLAVVFTGDPDGDGTPNYLNAVDAVLSGCVAPARDGSIRTGMYIDVRGNVSPTLDIAASFSGTLLVTCQGMPSDADPSGPPLGLLDYLVVDPNDPSLAANTNIQVRVGPPDASYINPYGGEVLVFAGSSAADVAAALASTLGGTTDGIYASIPVSGPGAFSASSSGILYSDSVGVTDTPAASSLVLALQARTPPCVVRYDGDGL